MNRWEGRGGLHRQMGLQYDDIVSKGREKRSGDKPLYVYRL